MKANRPVPDWNPTSPEVQRDQRAAYDAMRLTSSGAQASTSVPVRRWQSWK